ncbi:MAG: AzlD domain-containing protein [Acidimicrobiia bacterium]|nr:AzlD domain-containing protein [Acidimicrobiia bacterium]
MTDFIAIVIVGLGTYAFRSIFIVALAGRTIPPNVIRALEFVGPAVLSALVVALLVDESGSVVAGIPELAALAAGGFAGWRTRNLIYTVVAGMGVFWLLRIWL